MRSAVIDLAALECLEAFPRDLDRLIVVIQVSPWRWEALQRAFPRAEVVEAWPPGDGPWQADVNRALSALASVDPLFRGVPLLDCLTELWRGELERLFTLSHLWVSGELIAAASSPWLRLADRLASFLSDSAVTAAGNGSGRRSGLIEKVLGSGIRGWALALEARLDPSHLRRARLARRAGAGGNAAVLMVSSYSNTTRAVLRLWSSLPYRGKGVLLETGPMASRGIELPEDVERLSVAGALAGSGTAARADVRENARRAADALREWRTELKPGGGTVAVAQLLSGARFVEQLEQVHMPGVISSIMAIDGLIDRLEVSRVAVGNEFGASERAALRYASSRGLTTDACQHGVIDGHYRKERVVADRFWTWDRASSDLLVAWGAGPRECFVELGVSGQRQPVKREASHRRDVVLFTQPYELIPLLPVDFMAEVIPPLERACRKAHARLIVKPHPLQTQHQLRSYMGGGARQLLDSRHPAELLSGAAVAIVLDSSVVVDCRHAGVPCLGVGWYPGSYGDELVRLGYMTRAHSPGDLEQLVIDALVSTPFELRREPQES